MKINEVERITGLTQKAIRLYESQGLVKISRDENGYRNYSEEDVRLFQNIKVFRSLGVSVSDIKKSVGILCQNISGAKIYVLAVNLLGCIHKHEFLCLSRGDLFSV